MSGLALPLALFATGALAVPTLGQAQDAAKLIAQGDSLLALDRPQKAVDKYTEAIQMDGSAGSYAARARAWYRLDRMDRFVLDVDKALKLDSVHAEANYHRAIYGFRGEDFKNAERYATAGLAGTKDEAMRAKLLTIRGEARVELKKTTEAIADLRAGLGDRTDDPPALKSLARVLDATGDHAGSLAVLEKLCMVEPDDIGNWTNRGYELSALGRYEDALTVYGEALTLDKDEPTVLSNRAFALLKLGRRDEALADVERSLRSYPSNAVALRTRGELYALKGMKEKGCADLHLARILGGVADVDALIDQHCAGMAPKR